MVPLALESSFFHRGEGKMEDHVKKERDMTGKQLGIKVDNECLSKRAEHEAAIRTIAEMKERMARNPTMEELDSVFPPSACSLKEREKQKQGKSRPIGPRSKKFKESTRP
jgi:hypothetical protein